MAEINKEDLFSDEALAAPKELAKSLGAVAASIDAITSASAKSEKQLKESTSTTGITKQTEQLTAQEKELLKVQNQITVALAKNNDEYIEHKRGLDAINRAVKEKINKGREDLTFTGQMKNAMKDLKTELKEAKNAMLLAADAGGTMSKEYQQAAKQAGEIADKIGDAKDEAKVFANDTAFGSLGTRVGLLKDKVMALDFKGVGEQLKGIGKIILTHPLMLLVGVLVGIGAAIYALRDKVGFLRDAFTTAGEVLDWMVQKGKDFLDWTGATTFAMDDLAKATVDAANEQKKAIEERYDQEIKLAGAAGKETIGLEIEKQKAIRDTALEAVTHLLKKKSLNEDEKKMLEEQADIASKAILSLDVLKEQSHQADIKRFEERKKQWEVEGAALTAKQEAEAQAVIKKDEARQAELDKMLEHAEKTAEIQQGEYDLTNTLEKEKTENFMTLDELRTQRAKEESDTRLAQQKQELDSQLIALNDLSNAIISAANANDDTLRQLTKNFAIFILNQAERLITAQVLANATAKAAAVSLIPGASAIILARAAAAMIGIKTLFGVARAAINKFEVGTDNAPGGLAFVGEGGRELISTPDGKTLLSPDTATLINLPKGSQVIPNDETMRLLALAGMKSGNTTARDYSLVGEIKELRKSMKEGDDRIVEAINNSGNDLVTQGSLIYKVKQHKDGSRQLIRKKIFG